MSKQITPQELAAAVTLLLTDPAKSGELESAESFSSFMTDIAKVICDHCGGEVRNPASPLDDVWYVAIHGNANLPDAVEGIWRSFDPEGELFTEGTAEWFEAKFGDEHPEWTRAEWHNDVAKGDTRLGYWAWVAHNATAASESHA